MSPTALLVLCLTLAAAAVLLGVGWGLCQWRLRDAQLRLRESERLRFELLRQNGEVRQRLTATPGAEADIVLQQPVIEESDDALDWAARAPTWDDTRPVPVFQASSLFPATQPDPGAARAAR